MQLSFFLFSFRSIGCRLSGRAVRGTVNGCRELKITRTFCLLQFFNERGLSAASTWRVGLFFPDPFSFLRSSLSRWVEIRLHIDGLIECAPSACIYPHLTSQSGTYVATDGTHFLSFTLFAFLSWYISIKLFEYFAYIRERKERCVLERMHAEHKGKCRGKW